MNANYMTATEQTQLATLLDHHFGDGLVYLQDADDRWLLTRAMRLGLVDEAGYLTTTGYRAWRKRAH